MFPQFAWAFGSAVLFCAIVLGSGSVRSDEFRLESATLPVPLIESGEINSPR